MSQADVCVWAARGWSFVPPTWPYNDLQQNLPNITTCSAAQPLSLMSSMVMLPLVTTGTVASSASNPCCCKTVAHSQRQCWVGWDGCMQRSFSCYQYDLGSTSYFSTARTAHCTLHTRCHCMI